MNFQLRDGSVEYSRAPGTLGWKRFIAGIPATRVVNLAGSNSAIVLWDPMHEKDRRFDNLIRIDASGQIVWNAQTPPQQPSDAFTSFDIGGDGKLTARTWSGYVLEIDLTTGRTLGSSFAK